MYFQLNRYFNSSIYIREREELFKLKANIGTRTNGYKQPMNKFSLEIRRRLLPSEEWSSGTVLQWE